MQKSFEYIKILIRIVLILSLFTILLGIFFFPYTVSIGSIGLLIIAYLKDFSLKSIFIIEYELDNQINEEKNMINETYETFEDELNEDNKIKFSGNFIRINSVFNLDKNEMNNILNDFSTYGIIDDNILKSCEDTSYIQDDFINTEVQKKFYRLNFQDKKNYVAMINKTRKLSNQIF